MNDTFETDVRRYLELAERSKEIAEEMEEIKARIRAHGSGKVGELSVSVTQASRFSPVRAAEILTADQLAMITVTEPTISSTAAKRLLPPALYEACQCPYGDPRVSIR